MTNRPDIQWRRTWDDDQEGEDFTAWDGGRKIGRMYRGHRGNWQWFTVWGSPGGMEPSRREAMLGLEEAYLDLLASTADIQRIFDQRRGVALERTSKDL